MIRRAAASDVPQLVSLEEACFQHDRISPRSFKTFIAKPTSSLLVYEVGGKLLGYSLVLFHKNTSMARLYSLAISPDCRGQGLSNLLMDAAEEDALSHRVTRLRLEVHQSNRVAQKLYEKRGYKSFEIKPDYYEDHAAAVRMEKLLAKHLANNLNRVPYYEQTLEFTCGPACVLMAMKCHDPTMAMGRKLELDIWREATTIFMTTGHGGCGALGLALAAHRRGYYVEASVSDETDMFVDTVRDETKKEVIRLVEDGFLKEVAETDIRLDSAPLSSVDFRRHLEAGGVPIVLISAYRLTGDKAPHWVVVTAFDGNFLYINDPFTEPEKGRTATDCMGIPLAPAEFDRMNRFGKKKHYATLVIYPRRKD